MESGWDAQRFTFSHAIVNPKVSVNALLWNLIEMGVQSRSGRMARCSRRFSLLLLGLLNVELKFLALKNIAIETAGLTWT
jgi:hypothetical protein